jgi:hypothetical protein
MGARVTPYCQDKDFCLPGFRALADLVGVGGRKRAPRSWADAPLLHCGMAGCEWASPGAHRSPGSLAEWAPGSI